MEITLHLGAHRTASTFLQRGLASLDGQEAELALWLPQQRRKGVALPGTSQAERAVRLFDLRRRGVSHLVISEENLIGTMRGNLAARQLYPMAVPRLAQLRPTFGAVARIGLAVRSYDDYWASALAYQIGRGGSRPSDADIRALAWQPRRWRDVIEDIAQAFPEAELIVWSYETHGATPPLRALIGRSAALPPAPVNRRPKPRALSRKLGAPIDSDWPFTPQDRWAMRGAYRRDLDWLRGGAGGVARFITQRGDQDRTHLTHPHAIGGISHVRHRQMD